MDGLDSLLHWILDVLGEFPAVLLLRLLVRLEPSPERSQRVRQTIKLVL